MWNTLNILKERMFKECFMEVEGQPDGKVETKLVEQPQVSMEDLQAKIVALESTNGRLLSESKDNSDKYRSLRDKNTTREKIELEQSENWKERLELEKNEKLEFKEKFEVLKKTSLRKDLDFEVAKLIGNSPLNDGVSINDVIYQVMETGLIEVNDAENGFNNLTDAYTEVKKSKQFLFNTSKKPMINDIPSEGAPAEKKLNSNERMDLALTNLFTK